LLYSIKGKDFFPKAEKQFLKALEIKENVYSNHDIEVANYLDQISQFYLQFAEYPKTEALLKRSLDIKKATFGDDHPSIATTLDQLAQVYRKQGQYTTSKALFKQALQILEKARNESFAALTCHSRYVDQTIQLLQ
jgi:tetratricopeptide (TPR) repeat protein